MLGHHHNCCSVPGSWYAKPFRPYFKLVTPLYDYEPMPSHLSSCHNNFIQMPSLPQKLSESTEHVTDWFMQLASAAPRFGYGELYRFLVNSVELDLGRKITMKMRNYGQPWTDPILWSQHLLEHVYNNKQLRYDLRKLVQVELSSEPRTSKECMVLIDLQARYHDLYNTVNGYYNICMAQFSERCMDKIEKDLRDMGVVVGHLGKIADWLTLDNLKEVLKDLGNELEDIDVLGQCSAPVEPQWASTRKASSRNDSVSTPPDFNRFVTRSNSNGDMDIYLQHGEKGIGLESPDIQNIIDAGVYTPITGTTLALLTGDKARLNSPDIFNKQTRSGEFSLHAAHAAPIRKRHSTNVVQPSSSDLVLPSEFSSNTSSESSTGGAYERVSDFDLNVKYKPVEAPSLDVWTSPAFIIKGNALFVKIEGVPLRTHMAFKHPSQRRQCDVVYSREESMFRAIFELCPKCGNHGKNTATKCVRHPYYFMYYSTVL